ncbi:mannan endo-1,4-beta-mannosidase 2-like [Hibiscus syriacus]|uniref:mannan endo-1,4-beta-mannosidase 2-like n=1 Tax=Hibiscus syriacus TaxID=106335 RepID=UPI00192468D9|nr:mannan endo-1,4-beta-mannosidase 2-like [Hibiscus syriacus]
MAGNGMLYPILGFTSCMAFIYMSFGDLKLSSFPRERGLSFVEKNETHFFLDGKPLYVNGWNSYWLMSDSVEENTTPKVSAMLQAGARMGLTVCRTWAFNDGGYNALQISPGQFDERVFKALDYVIAEARQHGVRLLLSLVNNLQPYGGKTQYFNWAWQNGIGLSSSNDSFFYDPSIHKYFKNYVLVKKFRDKGHSQQPTTTADQKRAFPKRSADGTGDGFVTSARVLFNNQRHKAKQFVLRTMRGEEEGNQQGQLSDGDASAAR